jgi:cytoskeletal protein RodZ
MSKKVKVLISILVAALLLTMGGITMVMAEGEEETTPPPETSAKGLLGRIADVLEIDQEDLINAFKQAQQEMKEKASRQAQQEVKEKAFKQAPQEMKAKAFISRLNQAVAEGHVTQEEADEIRGWWAEKPEALNPDLFPHALRGFKVRPWLRLHKLAH